MREPLEDRMREYEAVTRAVLPRRTYTLIRVDGRAFRTFLKRAAKPFDHDVMASMDGVARALCAEIAGAAFAYAQSDEVSVLATDFATTTTQPWFGGVVQKMASVSASIATEAFNREYGIRHQGVATFDARVFTIPDPAEVGNYFLWRQRDGARNAVSMAARAHFSHRELHGVSTEAARERLRTERGVDYETYPSGARLGRVCTREVYQEEVTYTHKRTGQVHASPATRSRWTIAAAPEFDATRGWLSEHIPACPAAPVHQGGTVVTS
ncbi:tRNA(His) guanylyltransferase Thg1 family protein [Nocardiopsis synnemataformans]|uniref:tRNA(His) guanylyltransferase Thg1 family protein n=1 Tax=Nocardiopsis synnemataformans TaxID=61305 RepID=UPI003EBE9450